MNKQQYNEHQRKRRTSEINGNEFTNFIPIGINTFYRMRRKFDTDKLYKKLSSRIPLHQKKKYVYSLPITYEQQDIIWEAYVNEHIKELIA